MKYNTQRKTCFYTKKSGNVVSREILSSPRCWSGPWSILLLVQNSNSTVYRSDLRPVLFSMPAKWNQHRSLARCPLFRDACFPATPSSPFSRDNILSLSSRWNDPKITRAPLRAGNPSLSRLSWLDGKDSAPGKGKGGREVGVREGERRGRCEKRKSGISARFSRFPSNSKSRGSGNVHRVWFFADCVQHISF